MKSSVTEATFWRLLVIVVGSMVFAMAVPSTGDPVATSMLLPASIFVASTLALLTIEASTRRAKLLEAVRVELNKLRRVYHLSKNLAGSNPELRTWFTDLHGYIYGYLSGFSGKDFESYDTFNGAFRKVSYHIYTISEVKPGKDEVLYTALINTTGLVAEARQQIKELWDRRLTMYGWTLVSLLGAGYVIAAALAMNSTSASRIVGGVSIAAMLLAIDYLRETDTLASEKKILAERYVENMGRLELGRRHEE